MVLKMIAVSLSDQCIKSPRCPFCYATDQPKRDEWKLGTAIYNLAENNPDATICYEYSGYGIQTILKYPNRIKNPKTITTMPECIDPVFLGAIKSVGISAIALSYNSNFTTGERINWTLKADMIKDVNILLSCNYLVTKIPFKIQPEILYLCDQINLLALKPTGKYPTDSINWINMAVEKLKSYKTKVTLDSCLGVQLGYLKECPAGKDFIHVLPDGSKKACCFEDKCFLWRKTI